MRISEHGYCRIGENGESNNGFIVCDDCVIVVDTATSPHQTQKDLENLRTATDKKIKFLINTHYHGDHTFGNMYFSDIIAHKNCYNALKEATPRYIKYIEDNMENKEHFKDFALKLPNIVFSEEVTLFEPFEIRISHCSGHTSGSAIVYIPGEKVLFSGDLLFVGMHPYMGDADINQWITALKYLLQLEIATVIPGHGELCDKEEIKSHIDYLSIFYSSLKGLKKKYTKEEICRNLDLLGLPEKEEKDFLVRNIDIQYDRI
jgi:cyclase